MVVVEGYMDVVGLHRHGFTPAVATLGTAFTREQALLFKRLRQGGGAGVRRATRPGDAATLRGLDILAARGLEVRVAELPEGHDPDSSSDRRGLESFAQADRHKPAAR